MLYNDQVKTEIIQKFCDVFELNGFSGGNHVIVDSKNRITVKFYVDYIWIARVEHARIGYFSIGVARIRPNPLEETNTKLKGFLLAPPPNLGLNSIVSNAVDLNEEDLVAQALTDICVLPVGHLDWTDATDTTPTFAIYAATYKSGLHFAYNGLIEDNSVQKLWDAIQQMKSQLLAVYDIAELRAYFDQFPYIGR